MRLGWFAVPKVGTMLALVLATVPLGAQVRTIDPNQPIDSDLSRSSTATGTTARTRAPATTTAIDTPQNAYPWDSGAPPPYPQAAYPQQQSGTPPSPRYPDPPANGSGAPQPNPADVAAQDGARAGADASAAQSQTFQQGELLAAAEGTFGKGASGLAGILERTLKEQGQPNA